MGKIYRSLIAFLLVSGIACAQQVPFKRPSEIVGDYHKQGIQFTKTHLFDRLDSAIIDADKALSQYTALTLDSAMLSQVLHHRWEAIELTIPFRNTFLKTELIRVDPMAPDITISTPRGPVAYAPGVYYRGIMSGESSAIVALSVFSDQVIASISSPVLGDLSVTKVEGASGNYMIYSDRDFQRMHHWKCFTNDDPSYKEEFQSYVSTATGRSDKCVRLFYEVDHDIYEECGSNLSAAVNWMTAIHNNLATVFSNDLIHTSVSGIFVWDVPDPYGGATAAEQLSLFKENRPQLNGDLGQLVSMEPDELGGVAANINGFCDISDMYSYSDVYHDYEEVPVYSWTIEVLLHEFGHLMGSYHTHNCFWPGGAIDNCGPIAGFPNEGSCAIGPEPVDGGTIMSYCHLTPFGINLANGFGPEPANLIKSTINGSVCLTSDCAPIVPNYCQSSGQTSGEWIQKVQFNAFTYTSGQGDGYSDFTSHLAVMPSGTTVTFTIAPGYAGTPWNEFFTIWIDFNNDKDFFDKDEKVFESSETNDPVSGTFDIPKNLTGISRMRIAMKFEEPAGPCDLFDYGEVEDYSVSFDLPVTYCDSRGSDATLEWIDFVALNTLYRVSQSDSGYYDGTSWSTIVVLGSENVITYSAGMNGGKYPEYWKLWIDYNHDGDFDDHGEKVFGRKSHLKQYLVRKFTIPNTALLGPTRMRISMKRDSSPTSCEIFASGEVEDYTLNIIPNLIPPTNNSSAFEVLIYPNPAREIVTIEWFVPVRSGRIEIMDMTGRLMGEFPVSENSLSSVVNISSFVPGIYIARLVSGDNPVVTSRFIIH